MTTTRQSFYLRHIADIWLKTTDLTQIGYQTEFSPPIAIAWHSKLLMAVTLLSQAKNIP